MKTDHQKRVEDFMRMAGQAVPTTPCIPSEEVRLLRAKLIMEETLETVRGLGFETQLAIDDLFFIELESGPNLIEIADGCADILVVTIGTLSACGISDRPLLEEVDESNLRKFGPGSRLRDDGKWLKPDDWQPPDIQKVLEEQGG